MSENVKIAVIIAAYNAEQYIDRCLSSIQSQTYKNWTAYVVNDGSIDSTGAVLEKVAANDDRIVYANTENRGVFSARRTAIDMVRDCKYLTFIDSDDYLCDNTIFERCIKKMLSEKIDCLNFNYVRTGKLGFKEKKECYWISKKEMIKNLLNNTTIDGNMPYAMYMTNIVKKYFKVYSYNNDDFLNKYDLLIHSEKVAYVPWCGYCYYVNPESQTHRDIREIDYLYYDHARDFVISIEKKYPKLKKECDFFRCRVLLWLVCKLEKDNKFKVYDIYKPLREEFRKNIIVYLNNKYFTKKERISFFLALIHVYGICYKVYHGVKHKG